ncbi:MAG: polyprenyl synthetase family protein [Bacteroidetes bacterium]|nr:polyprenyl synthetase family protein [Bacteroidota bacterium]
MHTIQELQDYINIKLAEQQFTGNPPLLYEPINYTLSQGGKRMRPMLTLLACEMFGGNIENAVYPSIGLEIFHNFTLLHDDIMDKAPIRRGKETVYKKWNINIAILSGDTMFALAYEYMLKTDSHFISRILPVLNQTAIEVCEGQQYDMNFETDGDITIADYIEMIRLKTAVLLGASLKIGAIVGGADDVNANHIYDFGINIGLAFQLKDDLLDVYADVEKFGKITGGDIVTNKKTFLYLKAFDLANETQSERLQHLFNLPETEHNAKVNGVKALYDELNIEQLCKEEMQRYYEKAFTALDKINVSNQQKQELMDFAEQLIGRES